uniref:p20 n=1 Tax=Neospora caninum TaxID=29176 RepID=Q9BKL9_NEOCA|nr:P20 [Neospora caninum]
MNKPGPFRRLLGYGLLLGAVVLEAAFDLSAPAEAVALRRLDQKETVQALVEQHRFSNDYDQEARVQKAPPGTGKSDSRRDRGSKTQVPASRCLRNNKKMRN